MNRYNVVVKGDCHGDTKDIENIVRRLSDNGIDAQSVVFFVAGDFGIPWPLFPKEDTNKLERLNRLGCTIVAVLGNHEWWPLVYRMPEAELFGGEVHQCVFGGVWYENIFYVADPTVMSIDGADYLLIPGADSHDIRDGIFSGAEPAVEMQTYDDWKKDNGALVRDFEKRFLRENGRLPQFRTNDVTWFREETVQTDKVRDIVNRQWRFNAVISHDIPAFFVRELQHGLDGFLRYEVTPKEMELQRVHDDISFDMWIVGHFHQDKVSMLDTRTVISYHTPHILSCTKNLTIEEKYDIMLM